MRNRKIIRGSLPKYQNGTTSVTAIPQNLEYDNWVKNVTNKIPTPQVGINNQNSPLFYQTPTNASQPLGTTPPNTTTSTDDQIADNTPMAQNKVATNLGAGYNADANKTKNFENSPPRMQFFNPYGGVDLATGASYLGSSIENKDTAGIVAGGLKTGLGLARNIFGGMGQQRMTNNAMKAYNEEMRNAQRGTLTNINQDGGVQEQDQQMQELVMQVQQALQGGADPQQVAQQLMEIGLDENQVQQLMQVAMQQAPQMRDGGAMTGQYMIEKPNVQNPVAELEVDEYVKRPDGVIQKVEGETHENGGVLVDEEQLPDGSQIVSDHREVGDKAREYSKLLGVKIKPTDTFASVIEKREKQIGLTKIVEEQEEILAKLKKQTDKLVLNPEKESTLRLNIDMLQRQFNEKEQEKEPLKAQVAEIFNMTFQDQEVEKMEDGGDMVIGYAKKYKIDPERAKQLISTYLNGGQHLPKYQDGTFGSKGRAIPNVPEGQSANSEFYGKVTPQQFQETVQNNPWFDWRGFNPNNPNDVKKFQMEYNNRSTDGTQVLVDGKFGEQTQTIQLPPQAMNLAKGINQNNQITAPLMNNSNYVPPTNYDQDFGEIQTEEEKRRMGLLLLPDQTRRPLGAMLPPTRQQVQAREIQPNLQSPDDMLREIARSEQQAMAQIQNLPEQQRAAAIAQLQAGTQEQKAKIMSQVAGANQNAIMATDERNANELSRVDGANVSLAGKYQDQLFKTLAVQDASQRALDEQAIQTQVGNYGYIQKRNDLNMAYGDTYMDEFGNIVTDKTKMPDYQRPMGTVTPKAKKPGVGRSGGRFKKS